MPEWLNGLTDRVWSWLLSLRDERHPACFRWCAEGDLIAPGPHAMLGASAMAMKTAAQIGRFDRLPEDERAAWVRHIRSFQTFWPPSRAGLFADPALVSRWDADAGGRPNIAVRRAETRQACAALMAVGAGPRLPLFRMPWSSRGVRGYLARLPWTTDPWAAGSHASHLGFFTVMNGDRLRAPRWKERQLRALFDALDRLQDPPSGAWFQGQPPAASRVNGAMKILTLYDLTGREVPRADRLVDFCLANIHGGDACHNVDIVYALCGCAKWTPHRRGEIDAYLRAKLDQIRGHLKPGGGFSFYPERSGTAYYGAAVSEGRNVGDVHGTHLLTWAITMAADLLGFREQLGWRLPVT
jgi:hypothetical protein